MVGSTPNVISVKANNTQLKKYCRTFGEQVNFPGLRECSDANHVTIRISWILFVIVGLTLTFYCVYATVVEYLNEPTLTKVNLKREIQSDEIAPTYICLAQWANKENMYNLNLSHLGGKYLYSLIGMDQVNISEYEIGKSQFENFAKLNNITFYDEAFILGSISLDQMPSVYCSRCTVSDKVQFAAASRQACFKVEPTSKPVSSYSVTFVTKVDSTQVNYLLVGEDIRYVEFPDMISLTVGKSYQVNVDATRIVLFNDLQFPCMAQETVQQIQYDRKVCVDRCFTDLYVSMFNCQILTFGEPILNAKRNLDICSNSFHGYTTLADGNQTLKDAEVLETIEHASEICQSKCPFACESLTYDYSMTSSINQEGRQNSTTVTFKLTYKDTGVLTVEEISAYSFVSVVSNVGGQLGLWMGFSMITGAQFLFYFVNKYLQTLIVT